MRAYKFGPVGLVENVILVDPGATIPPGFEAAGGGEDLAIGDRVDPETGDLIRADRAAVRDSGEDRVLSFRNFMDLFPEAEQLAIIALAVQSPQVGLWLSRAQGGSTLSLDHPDVAAGLAFLQEAGAIAAGRPAIILGHDLEN